MEYGSPVLSDTYEKNRAASQPVSISISISQKKKKKKKSARLFGLKRRRLGVVVEAVAPAREAAEPGRRANAPPHELDVAADGQVDRHALEDGQGQLPRLERLCWGGDDVSESAYTGFSS